MGRPIGIPMGRPTGIPMGRPMGRPIGNPPTQWYTSLGQSRTPHFSLPPPSRNQDGAKVALEVLKKVSQRFFGVPWVPFGTFGVQFWSRFGVSCSLVHGSKNEPKIDDLGRS